MSFFLLIKAMGEERMPYALSHGLLKESSHVGWCSSQLQALTLSCFPGDHEQSYPGKPSSSETKFRVGFLLLTSAALESF